MGKMTVHDKAIRLIEGGIVEIDGNWFRLIRFPDDFDGITCMECELDSICQSEHEDVCGECEAIYVKNCCLQLASKER